MDLTNGFWDNRGQAYILFSLKFVFQQTQTLTNDTCLHFLLLPSEPEGGYYSTDGQTSYALS